MTLTHPIRGRTNKALALRNRDKVKSMDSGAKNSKARRVLYVENGIGYGGAVICMRHLVRNLDRTRYEPMVVTGRTGPQYQEISREAKWKYIPDRRFDTERLKRELEKVKSIESVPILGTIVSQIIARTDDLINFFPFFVQMLKTILAFRPALIHVNNEPLCNRGAILAGKLLRIPVICHVRGGLDGSRMMKWLYKQPRHFIAVSRWISKSIEQIGVPPSANTVVYDGIELNDLNVHADGKRFRSLFKVPDDAFAVGLVGLLIPWKGQKLFLEAASLLAREIPTMHFLIIGDAPEDYVWFKEELYNYVQKTGLGKSVVFTGHIDDMAPVYNGLDIVLSASTQPEPLGTMVIECMAMGRPLVAPNHGGAAEMADHGNTAVLFEPGNVESMVASIQQLYEEPDLRMRLGQAARQKAIRTFSVEQHVNNVQSIYDDVFNDASYDGS